MDNSSHSLAKIYGNKNHLGSTMVPNVSTKRWISLKSNEQSLDHDGLMQIIEYNRSKYRPNWHLDNP